MPNEEFKALAASFLVTLESGAVWIIEGASRATEDTLAGLPLGLGSKVFLGKQLKTLLPERSTDKFCLTNQFQGPFLSYVDLRHLFY